jgi:hypothetical protein
VERDLLIGEVAARSGVSRKALEWNVLVDAITSGRLGRV